MDVGIPIQTLKDVNEYDGLPLLLQLIAQGIDPNKIDFARLKTSI